MSIEKEALPYEYPKEIEQEYKGCFDTTELYNCSPMAWAYSFIGEYNRAILADNQDVQMSKRDSVLNLNKFELKEARNYILRGAANTSLVIFNEAHHRPEHRIYTTDFLEEFYKMGYRYLSLEAMSEETESLHSRGKPSMETGFYIREPQFANMIRHALTLGYTIVPHDIDERQGEGIAKIKHRELAQAKRIAQIFEKDSLAKVIAHVGYGHIREDTAQFGGLMAYQVKKMTGINPLTVGQSRYNSESESSLELEYYKQYTNYDKPSTLIYKEKDIPYNDFIVDIDVFHPRIKDSLNRPSYLMTNERYQVYKFAVPNTTKRPILAFLYFEESSINYASEVPIDIAVVKESQDTVLLTSPFKTNCRVVFFDDNKMAL